MGIGDMGRENKLYQELFTTLSNFALEDVLHILVPSI